MKKLLLLLLVLALFSVSAYAEALRFSMVGQDPNPVRAGDVVKLRFKVENMWDKTRYDIRVGILPEYPFSLYGEDATKEIGQIDGRQYGSNAVYFDFKMKVDNGASDGDHEIRLRVYDGNQGTWDLKNMFYVDVEYEDIKVKPYIVSSNLITSGKSGAFTVEMANSGGVDVESLELELLPSEDYKLLSTSSYVYIGKLESDDTESEDFNVYVNEGVQDVKIPVRLTYEYKDKQYSQDTELTLHLLTEDEAKKIGLIKSSNMPYIIGAVIVVILGIFLMRRFRKR